MCSPAMCAVQHVQQNMCMWLRLRPVFLLFSVLRYYRMITITALIGGGL